MERVRGDFKDRLKKAVKNELEWKDLAVLGLPSGQNRETSLITPSHTTTLSQPTIFPECAAYFPCQGGVLHSKFHQMSKTGKRRDYIKEDGGEGGGVSLGS